MNIGNSIRDITYKMLTDTILKEIYTPVHNFSSYQKIFNGLREPVRDLVLSIRMNIIIKYDDREKINQPY